MFGKVSGQVAHLGVQGRDLRLERVGELLVPFKLDLAVPDGVELGAEFLTPDGQLLLPRLQGGKHLAQFRLGLQLGVNAADVALQVGRLGLAERIFSRALASSWS